MEFLEKALLRSKRCQRTARFRSATTKDESSDTLELIRHITEDLNQCPNKLWSVVKNLPGGIDNIPRLFSSKHVDQLLPRAKENHAQCSFELCELSQRNFTSVEQRHEGCFSRYDCHHLQDHFPSHLLDQAAEADECTAWKLTGKSLVKFPHSYVAISHVWSDGTGAGAWPEKGVNRCLWFFFMEIARSLQVSGIWWDTVCIPKAKAARSRAINRMHCNYEDATVTVVHDCFLRDFGWDDGNPQVSAEMASLAIVMSPWFSRGWTALELAKSLKVKILFKKRHAYVLKDLDNDILVPFEKPSATHLTATKAIKSLRNGKVTEINNLLTALGPRYTSWSRDMAIIAGLLTGIEVLDTNSQQDIYQKILRKIGKICHGHLFHNSATMSKGFNWCPANILNMPLSPSTPSLRVEDSGNVVGTWKVVKVGKISPSKFAWIGIPPLTETGLRAGVGDTSRHVFLVEPDVEMVSRALLVKVTGRYGLSQRVCGQPIGFLPLSPAQHMTRNMFVYAEVSLGVTESVDMEAEGSDAWSLVKSCQLNHKHLDDGTGRRGPISMYIVKNPLDCNSTTAETPSNEQRQTELLQAAGEGDEQRLQLLLNEEIDVNFQDTYGWTPLHYAAWRGHEAIVKVLASQEINLTLEDKLGQQPSHLAAARGHHDTLKILIDSSKTSRATCTSDKQTVMHRGVWSGSTAVVRLLGASPDLDAVDANGQTTLHIAARQSCFPVARLLVEWTVDVNVRDKTGSTPLAYAAQNGDETIVRLLLGVKHVRTNSADWLGRTPLHLAARHGHDQIVRALLDHTDIDARAIDSFGRSPIFHAASHGHRDVVRLICEHDKKNATGSQYRMLQPQDIFRDDCHALFETFHQGNRFMMADTRQNHYQSHLELNKNEHPLLRAAFLRHGEIVEFLLEHGVYADSKEETRRFRDTARTIPLRRNETALQVAITNEDEISVRLLLATGEVDVNYHEEFTFPPLFLAVMMNNERLTALLFEAEDINVNVRDLNGDSILVHAAAKGNTNIIERLLTSGKLDVNYHDKLGMTPLANAAKKGHENVVKLLLSTNDIQVDLPGFYRSPLSYACEFGHEAVVKLLLDTQKVDVDHFGLSNRTPLMHASENGHEKVVRLLLDVGHADIGKWLFDDTAIGLAARNGHVAITQLLLERAQSLPNGRRMKVKTSALHYAAYRGFVAIVKTLLKLDENFDLDTPDKHLRTPLSYAAEAGNIDFVKELLSANCDINLNSQDELLRTPISYAAEFGRSNVISELLAYGEKLDVNLEDAMGYTPLFYAFIIGDDPEVVAQLLSTERARLGSGCPEDAIAALESFSEELRSTYPTLFRMSSM